LKLIMCTVCVCVCVCVLFLLLFYLFQGICIAMLVTYFSVTSLFQLRTFISSHTIVSHYLPSIMQNNITLETQDTTLGEVFLLGNELPLSAAYNSLQESQ
jgi:hypothetical protein